MVNTDEMQRRIESTIAGSKAQVVDLDGAGKHYEVVVVADVFEGQSLIDRHRMVYAALGEVVGGDMHAAKLTTMTPKEREE